MRDSERKLWKTPEQALGALGAPSGEFPEGAQEAMELPEAGPSRRRFLGLLGASAALASGSACSRKVDRGPIVAYTRKPEEVIPGVAAHYASTFQEGETASPVLVKSREGRPIHVQGNDEHPFGWGKAPLRATADLLGLYDPDRLRGPVVDGKPATWDVAEGRLAAGVKDAVAKGTQVVLMTGAVVSPALASLVDELGRLIPGLRHVALEPASDAVARDVAREVYGEPVVARPRYDKADVVLSLGADFLGTMDGASQAIAQFAGRRKPADVGSPMSRLWVLEGSMTLTGSKADHRLALRPSALGKVGFAIARALAVRHGLPLPAGLTLETLPPLDLGKVAAECRLDAKALEALAGDLARAKSVALAVAGPGAPPEAHAACHLLNAMLGAVGATVELEPVPRARQLATAAVLDALVADLGAGKVGALISWGVNPSYVWPDAAGWAAAAAKAPFRAHLALSLDETAAVSGVVLPVNHWLESWGDFDAGPGLTSLRQPLIAPLFDTRQGEEVLLALAIGLGARLPGDFHAYLAGLWQQGHSLAGPVPFERFWHASLHDGFVRRAIAPAAPPPLKPAALVTAAAAAFQAVPAEGLELQLVPDSKVYDGRYANNGWLQELPDPVSKVVWGNPLSLSLADAKRLGLALGDEVRLEAAGRSVTVPVLEQPGQAEGVVTLALGYGRAAGSVAAGVGVSAWPLVGTNPASPFGVGPVKVTPAGRNSRVVRTQEHHSLDGRDLAKLWTRAEYAKERGAHEEAPVSLYADQQFPEHKWGMAIDLSGCVGCSACVIACQSENNVPVVGPEQVERGREMAWLRIDRYYEGSPDAPRVVHEPMLCQHCDSAPCENVCPVAATTHSPDGLNQMAYNRCVGTRYCANNCPYKVRRFNFFEFNQNLSEVRDLAFNPEVTVRPRGVMEKCTFCVQRISNAKQVAKAEGRPMRDGDVKPACAVACPAEAITFGDLKDASSRVAKLAGSDRRFHVLGELGVRPAVTYLADVRNPSGEGTE